MATEAISPKQAQAAQEDKVRAKLDAEIAQAQERLVRARAHLAEADKRYAAAAAAERKAWGDPRGEPKGKQLAKWQAASDELERAVVVLHRAHDAVAADERQLAKLQAPEEYDERTMRKQQHEARFGGLRERTQRERPAKPARVVVPDPPSADEHKQVMAANEAGYLAYQQFRDDRKAAVAAGDTKAADAAAAGQDDHKPAYSAYKKAYMAVLALRKEARASAVVGDA